MTEQEPRWRSHTIVEDKQHPWRYVRWFGHGPNTNASVEWNLFPRTGFGLGFRFGRNGSESDVGLDMYAGRIGSAWLRLRSPWTRWARIERQGDDDRDWHKARHYGIRLFPFDGMWFEANWAEFDGEWSRDQSWYREIKFGPRHLWGRTKFEKTVEDGGECEIPMPEGSYRATWELVRFDTRYTRWPGKWRNYWQRPRRSYSLDIEGGIPHQGKGENSWDCGMGGLFGCGGQTLEEAISHAIASSMRDRKRYGGPHDLPEPMTARQAEEWVMARG